MRGVQMVLAGLVCAIRRSNRNGRFVTIEDHTGRLEVALYDEAFTLYAELLNKDEMIVVEGKVSVDDFSGGLSHDRHLVSWRWRSPRRVLPRGVRISVQGPLPELDESLAAALKPYRNGLGKVYPDYRNPRARARLELGDQWRVNPCEELVAALSDLPGVTEASWFTERNAGRYDHCRPDGSGAAGFSSDVNVFPRFGKRRNARGDAAPPRARRCRPLTPVRYCHQTVQHLRQVARAAVDVQRRVERIGTPRSAACPASAASGPAHPWARAGIHAGKPIRHG